MKTRTVHRRPCRFFHRRPCRFFHRWPSLEESSWVGGIANPVFLQRCRRCGEARHVKVVL